MFSWKLLQILTLVANVWHCGKYTVSVAKLFKSSIQITVGSKITKLNANMSSKLPAYILLKKYTNFTYFLLYSVVNIICNVDQND